MCLSIAMHRPDDVLGKGEHQGFRYEIIHNGMGFRCGYVRVPFGHPWWGKPYDEVEADVHGGLTFAEADTPCVLEAEEEPGWWLGFDCAHGGDAPDPSLEPADMAAFRARVTAVADAQMERAFGPGWREALFPDAVRSQEYVEAECHSLCEQAAAVYQGANN